jgi:nucleotide-binding universal stress UspA family protein
VLAVPAGRHALPGTAVVGVDFTPGSRQAAAAAARLVGPGGMLILVHVTPCVARPTTLRGDWLGDDAELRLHELHAFAETLPLPHGTRVRCLVRHGRPAAELLAASVEWDADLIALGTSNGLVPLADVEDPVSRIVRGATCSVLVAPPAVS